jgi:uncharacterized membrane protein
VVPAPADAFAVDAAAFVVAAAVVAALVAAAADAALVVAAAAFVVAVPALPPHAESRHPVIASVNNTGTIFLISCSSSCFRFLFSFPVFVSCFFISLSILLSLFFFVLLCPSFLFPFFCS